MRLSIGGHFSEATAFIDYGDTVAHSLRRVNSKHKESVRGLPRYGGKDILENALCRLKDVFADIVNNLVFGGMQRVKEDELEQASDKLAYQGEKTFRELERDVTKYWKNNAINIALLGLENQTVVDNDMPIRVIGYDGASYRDQIRYETDENGNRKKTVERLPDSKVISGLWRIILCRCSAPEPMWAPKRK